MKVIKVINSLDFGGIEKVYEIVAKYYKGNRSDLIFVVMGFGGKASRTIESRGYRVIILNEKTKIPNVRLIMQLFQLFKHERPQVVHTCGAEGNFHGLIAAFLARVPVRIGEEIGMPSHSRIAKIVFRLLYKRCNAVIAVARSVQQYLVENREVSGAKCPLIYNPVDLDHFFATTRQTDPNFTTFITVSRLHPIKNLDSFLRCFAKLARQRDAVRLWIVGDGAIRQDLERLAISLEIDDKVVFHGFKDDPRSLIERADIFVLPSLSEGHPVSLIEAMIAGLPCIATKVGGAAEIIIDNVNGWLIDPKDEQQIISVLLKATDSTHMARLKMAERAKAKAVADFGPTDYFQRLDHLYSTSLQ